MKPSGFQPIKRIRQRRAFKFVLANGETMSFPDEQCRPCIFFKKPKGCRKHIIENWVEEEPLFRMNLSLNSKIRNCTINPRLNIHIPRWKPNWWLKKKQGPTLTKEGKALWDRIKEYMGEKTPEGYKINGFINDKDLFRKGLKYGLISKDSQGKWIIIKPTEDK